MDITTYYQQHDLLESRLQDTLDKLYISTEFAPSLKENLEIIKSAEHHLVHGYAVFRHDVILVVSNLRMHEQFGKKLVEKGMIEQDDLVKDEWSHISVEEIARRVAVVVVIDLALHDPVKTIQTVRENWPSAIFVLHYSEDELAQACKDLHPQWSERLAYYYVIPKDDGEHTTTLNTVLQSACETAIQRRDRVRSRSSVFISYSQHDKELANQMVSRLRTDGFKVWIDHKRLEAGTRWMDEINNALEVSEYLVLLMSNDSLASKYVQHEYEYFVRNNKPIIPVRIAPLNDLPPDLASIQYVDYVAMGFELTYSHVFGAISNK